MASVLLSGFGPLRPTTLPPGSLGMADATVAVGSGATALTSNPAGMAQRRQNNMEVAVQRDLASQGTSVLAAMVDSTSGAGLTAGVAYGYDDGSQIGTLGREGSILRFGLAAGAGGSSGMVFVGGAMNRLKISELSLAARWRLAAAYQLAGQPEAGRELIAGQSRDVPAYRELSGTFGSDLRDEAMILETLVLLGDQEDALGQARKVSAALTSQEQLSTQTAAYALVAMARFASLGDSSASTKFEWQGPDGKWHEVSSPHPLVQVPISLAAAASSVSVAVRNPGKGFLSSRVISKGTAALATEGSAANWLELTVTYQRADGQQVDATEVSQGTDFKALVTVRNASRQKLQELALSQVLPSGWETHGESPGKGEGFAYRDVRDDRVDTYFDLNPGEKRSFELALHASFLGHFYLPAVQIEAMYDSTVFAREGGRWIDVVPVSPES